MRVINSRNGQVVAARVRDAQSFFSRLRGLIGSPPLAADEGLLLKGDNSIHSFLMRYPFDAVYLDADFRVLRVDASMRPNRVGPIVRGARSVLELAAQAAARCDLRPGDVLVFEP